ncbi:hypothetical protein PCL_00011 [Purpureocillium lilacinum]|uniref:Transmembrane protein n=1 Tax=Purpureocillium lilacinum TaxID=33203 RepID=A0A2U3DPA9_PURLI|nr:hypothetical protein PCL_00011 [Purpureocillium lilacinum]
MAMIAQCHLTSTLRPEMQPRKYLTSGTNPDSTEMMASRSGHGADEPDMSLREDRPSFPDGGIISDPSRVAMASRAPIPHPPARDASLDVFVQWGLAPWRCHQQHTYLTRLTITVPLTTSVTKLKEQNIQEFLNQRKLWRLLLAGVGKTVVGTALMSRNYVRPAPIHLAGGRLTVAQSTTHQTGLMTDAHIYGFSETSLLSHVWQMNSTPDGHQHQVSQLEALRRTSHKLKSSMIIRNEDEAMVLVVRLIPDELKITIFLISFAVILGFIIATITSDVANVIRRRAVEVCPSVQNPVTDLDQGTSYIDFPRVHVGHRVSGQPGTLSAVAGWVPVKLPRVAMAPPQSLLVQPEAAAAVTTQSSGAVGRPGIGQTIGSSSSGSGQEAAKGPGLKDIDAIQQVCPGLTEFDESSNLRNPIVLAADGAAFPYVESTSSVSTSTRISEGGCCTSIAAGVGVVAADVVSSIYLPGGERDDDDALMREREGEVTRGTGSQSTE